jgi:predicted secreted protein
LKRYVVAFCLSTWAALAAAGDQAQFRPLGFSENGQYYAFAQIGIHDGSGFPYAEVAVVDVAKNDLVAVQRAEIPTNSGASAEDALKKALAGIGLARFGIKKEQEPGTDLLWREPTDSASGPPYRFTFTSMGHGPALAEQPEYEVLVEESKTAVPADQPLCADLGGPRLLKLSLVGRERSNGAVLVLQADKRLPKSRACPLGYQVRGVTEYGEGLVVVLAYTRPGFEGPDTRYMVVTGNAVPAP